MSLVAQETSVTENGVIYVLMSVFCKFMMNCLYHRILHLFLEIVCNIFFIISFVN